VVMELPFSGDWDTLVRLGSRWVWDVDFSGHASRIVRQKLERATSALVKPYPDWLSEDYFIFHVREISGSPTVAELVASQGARIAQIVRGETAQLSDGERNEILQSRISYYPNDLAVIGWNAAFLYDSEAGAETAIQLLEYANSQLLEFRHYDELLTRELGVVYAALDKGTGMLARWRLARAATKLHTVLLDVNELTERANNAIKFLTDMFAARTVSYFSTRSSPPPPVQAGRCQGRRAGLQRPGQPETAYCRGPVPLHGGPVQPEPCLRARTHGGDHPGHRTSLPVRRQVIAAT